MTVRQVVDCDKCGEESVATPVHVAIPNGIDKETGPAGELETYTHYEQKDLCPGCVEKAFKLLHGSPLAAGGTSQADKILLRWLGIKERT